MSEDTNFDGICFQRFIEHDNFQTREVLKSIGRDPIFSPRYNIPLEEKRELSYQRLRKVAEAKAFSVYDFKSNPLNLFALHEITS